MQKGNGIAELFQIADDVGRDQNCMVLIPHKVQQQIDELIPHHRIQAAGGFVQQQQLGVMRKCHGKALLHLHAGGVVAVLLVLRKVKAAAPVGVGGGIPIGIDARHHFPHLRRGQAGGDALAAQHHADIGFGKRGDPLLPEQLHSASVPVDHVQDQLNGRALARAVLTDQPADCAAGQFQINGPQRKIRVVLFKAVQF